MPAPKPSFPLPTDTECLTFTFPLEPNIRRVLVGLFYSPLLRYFWDEMTDDEWDALYQSMVMTLNGITMCNCGDCDDFLECIEGNQGIRDAILNLVTSPESVTEIIEVAKELGLIPVIPTEPAPNCNDNVYGACVQYVEQINQSLLDFFEQSETYRGEQIFEVISALDLDVSAPVGFISWLRDQAKDGYEASYTQPIADQMACDLFCLMKDTCGFSVQVAFDYHVSKIIDFIDLNTWDESNVLNLLASYAGFDDISAEVWVNGLYAIFVAQLLLFEQGLTQFGAIKSTITQLQKRIASWLNDPNPDWVIFCNCEPATVEIFSWGIARWRYLGGSWNDITYTDTQNGIPCGVINIGYQAGIEIEGIIGVSAMGMGWRDIWVSPVQKQVRVTNWETLDTGSYYWQTSFVTATPPDALCLEVGVLTPANTLQLVIQEAV